MSLSETELKYANSFIELQSTHAVASEFGVTSGTVTEHIRKAKQKCEHTREKINALIKSRREKRNSDRTNPTALELFSLVESQGYRCSLTGDPIKEPSTASLDHKQPRALGGTNQVENLQWVLKEINDMKGTLTQERFIELCCKVADHHRATKDAAVS